MTIKIPFSTIFALEDGKYKFVLGDGRPVRIIDRNRKAKSGCIVGLVGDDEDIVYCWNEYGDHIASGDPDKDLYTLVDIPDSGLPDDMDPECVALCNVLNSLPDTETCESCCGHYKAPFSIWFHCNSIGVISRLARCVERNYSDGKWELVVDSCDTSPYGFFWLRSKEQFLNIEEMERSVSALIGNILHWTSKDFDWYFKNNEYEEEDPKLTPMENAVQNVVLNARNHQYLDDLTDYKNIHGTTVALLEYAKGELVRQGYEITKRGEDGQLLEYNGNPKSTSVFTSEERLDAIKNTATVVSSSVEKSKEFLTRAGIMDENGNLAEKYRGVNEPTDFQIFLAKFLQLARMYEEENVLDIAMEHSDEVISQALGTLKPAEQ